jgi:hypothetical protein
MDKLVKMFNESVVGRGLSMSQQSVVKLYVNTVGRWTILVTLNNGMSCHHRRAKLDRYRRPG